MGGALSVPAPGEVCDGIAKFSVGTRQRKSALVPVAMALIRARGTEIIFLPPYSLEVGPLSRMSAVVCN